MKMAKFLSGQEFNGRLHKPLHFTSLQSTHFHMPIWDSTDSNSAVGIFMENGSGSFVSDLSFFRGNIGFRAGSQQFTAAKLQFNSA